MGAGLAAAAQADQWRIVEKRILSVATGDVPRRSEVRLEADDRPPLEGNAFTRCGWFGRCWDYRTMGGRRIPFGAEAGWTVEGKEFVYWRGTIENWLTED
jgi:hypothetical protein